MSAPVTRTKRSSPPPSPPPPPEQPEPQSISELPPHSIEAELGVLGCIMLDPANVLADCITILKAGPVIFYDLRHRTIYEHLVWLWDNKKPVDLITLHQSLRDAGRIDDVGGLSYLASLPDKSPSAANLPHYAEILIKKYTLRRIIHHAVELARDAKAEPQDVSGLLSKASAEVDNVTQLSTPDDAVASMKVLIPEAMDHIEHLRQNKGALLGLPTGLIDLDMMTWGLQKDSFIVIAARPSVGKTALGMNIADYVTVDYGAAVGVFSLEMSRQALVVRMLCSRARVSSSWVQTGDLSEASAAKLTEASTKLFKAPLHIDDSSQLSILQLRARARQMQSKFGIKLIIVDYLQLMTAPGTRNDRQQEVSIISRGLKALSKELHLPVLALAQLNRNLDARGVNAKPRLSDLRESGSIEQDADVVILLHRTDKEELPQNSSNITAIVAKHRNGPTGEIPLVFLKSCTRFECSAKVSAEDAPPPEQDLPLDNEKGSAHGQKP